MLHKDAQKRKSLHGVLGLLHPDIVEGLFLEVEEVFLLINPL